MDTIPDIYRDGTIIMTHFQLLTPKVTAGESLSFTFTLQNTSDTPVYAQISYELRYTSGTGESVCQSYPIPRHKCPSGFLLYNQKQIIPADILSGRAVSGLETGPSESCAAKAQILPFPGSRHLPGRLTILVGGKVLGSAAFEVAF